MENLFQANKRRAVLIASLCASRLDAVGRYSMWQGYECGQDLDGQLRTDTLIQYQRHNDDPENYTRLFFHNPTLTEVETVDWGEEVKLQTDVIERFREPIQKVKGIAYEDTIKHTFSKTTSLQEAFKVGAKLAIETYFKASYSGVEGGAKVSAELSAEYSRQWGEQTTVTDSVERHISLPADYEGSVIYEAVRSVDKVQRHITATSNLDYKIEFVSGPKPEPVHATWESVDEFIAVATGAAASTHALYDVFIDNRISDNEADALKQAGVQSIAFLADYDNVQSQEIRIV